MNAADAIRELHSTWCEVTRQDLHPKATERLFFEFWRAEFTAQDLRCVLDHMQRFNRQNPGAQFRLHAQKVLGDLEMFASTLAETRAKERNRRPAPTARQQVEALRDRPVDAECLRTAAAQAGPITAAEAIKRLKESL